jgi:DNA-binding CsgD family transcriptional regulator/pimeloyl-ACP methyl ester carboxylesterase
MQVDPLDTNDTAEVELTKLVYTLVMEPERLYLMLQLLNDSVSPVFDLEEGGSAAPFFDNLQVHFDNAFDMLQRREVNEPNRSIARKLVDIDTQPSLLISREGMILRANKSAMAKLNVAEGARLDVSVFQKTNQPSFRQALLELDDTKKDRLIDVFEMDVAGEEAPWKMVMSKAVDNDGQHVAHLASLKTRWQSHTGEGFSQAFNLTPVEQVIVQALIEGNTLADVAEARGRSLGTVRNQLKRMLAKLGLKSQTELICMYAGFAQISVMPSGLHAPNVPPVRTDSDAHIFARENGTTLEVEFYGPVNGTPVLFFHPFMGGTLLSEAQKQLIAEQNLRFVMPLLPGFKGTTDAGEKGDRLGEYSRDVLEVLKKLHIKDCPALCVNTSYIYALALATASPDTLAQIVVANAAVPLKTSRQFKEVSMQQRIPYLVSKYVPSLLKFYVRSVQAKLDAGYDEEYITKYYESSPIDQETILSPEIRSLARLSIVRLYQNGHEAAVQHLRMEVSDWDKYFERVSLPITLLNGDKDTEYSHKMVSQSVAKYDNFTCEEVSDAGALMWYQQPESVLSYLLK